MYYLVKNKKIIQESYFSESQINDLKTTGVRTGTATAIYNGKEVKVLDLTKHPKTYQIERANDLLKQRSTIKKVILVSIVVAVVGMLLSNLPVVGIVGAIAFIAASVYATTRITSWLLNRAEFNQKMREITEENRVGDISDNIRTN